MFVANHNLPFTRGNLPGDQCVVAVRCARPPSDLNVIAWRETLGGAARIRTEIGRNRSIRAIDYQLRHAVLRRHFLNRSADLGFGLRGRARRPWMRLRSDDTRCILRPARSRDDAREQQQSQCLKNQTSL